MILLCNIFINFLCSLYCTESYLITICVLASLYVCISHVVKDFFTVFIIVFAH